MAEPTTQADVDILRRKYFKLADNTEWPADTKSTDAAVATAGGYVPKHGSLSQGIQDDLNDLLDAATTALA